MTDYRPPQISENEAHIWQALSRAARAAEEASLALAVAQQRMSRDQPRGREPKWALVREMLRYVGEVASTTLAERQRAARDELPDLPIPDDSQ